MKGGNLWIFLSILNVILLIGTSILIFMIINQKCECEEPELNCEEKKEIVIEEEPLKNYHVEVKGAVNNPGVYIVNDNYIINDVIKMAGGFKNNAYSDNINLSRHLSDELVIYVYTKDEYKKNTKKEVDICNCQTYDISDCKENYESIITDGKETQTSNESKELNNTEEKNEEVLKLININTASQKELMTLPGIGESKANDIINYREKNGLFKSIEDIKKVNGIKDATYNKIKDSITV